LRAAWVSDVGKLRLENQDRVLAGLNALAVADGVGSAPGSAETADFVVRAFLELVASATDETDVLDAVHTLQSRIAASIDIGELPPQGATTLTAAVHCGEDLVVVNVGDSPAWLMNATGPRSLIRAQRRWDPFQQSYVLLSALGPSGLGAVASTLVVIDRPIRLVLASDGVLDPAEPDRFPDALLDARRGSLPEVVRRILRKTLDGAAGDNITVAVVDVGPEEIAT
jgi:protein phosphatase